MIKRKWHKGPPPHIGWWNASVAKDEYVWRWWDGSKWSNNTPTDSNPEFAANRAKTKAENNSNIEWTDYWPANARVPRVKL